MTSVLLAVRNSVINVGKWAISPVTAPREAVSEAALEDAIRPVTPAAGLATWLVTALRVRSATTVSVIIFCFCCHLLDKLTPS